MNIVLYLSENNMTFRLINYMKYNGKYLGLIQLLAKFIAVMQEHVCRILKDEIAVHYCGLNILNEFIQLMAEEVHTRILSSIQNAKYFSITADCT